MEHVSQTTNKVLRTEMREPITNPASTPASEIGTSRRWAEVFGFNTCGDKQLEGMLQAAIAFRQAFIDKLAPRWLTFLGNSGTGKTYLGRALWHRLKACANWTACDYQASAIYWPDFVQDLRMGESFGRRNDMKRWPVLFLDDVGAERDKSGFAAEELNTLLGCRVGRWTIITANLSLERLSQIDGRISSRVIRDHNILVEVDTMDYALRNKK
jgi:DNA replication protein DnaC